MASNVVVGELIQSKLDALRAEMLHLLYRSAYSTLMRESRDCSFLVTTPAGELVTDGPPYYRRAISNLLKRFPEPDEGDLFCSNHPYETGVQHTPDLLVMIPVFVEGTLVGFSCSTAHKPDVGGAVVGSASSTSTEIFQEGLLLPILRLGKMRGQVLELDPNVLGIIECNVRSPDLFFGDMRAQIGVTRVGADRLHQIATNFGVAELLEAYDFILDSGEQMLRRHLLSWPDGTVSVVGHLDDDGVRRGEPVRYALTVDKKGDSITFDFTDSDDQTLGPVNMQQTYMEQALFDAILAMTEPNANYNDGFRRVARVIVRDGSVFSPRFPAPVGASTVVAHRVRDMALEALGTFRPDLAVANSGGSGGTLALRWGALGAGGSRSMQYEMLGTATGASAIGDGCDGTVASSQDAPITSIEVLEAQFPVRVTRFELVPDSGGPGRFRGGLSYRREYECLAPATLNRRADRGKFPGLGTAGGKPGAVGRLVLDSQLDGGTDVPPAGNYQFEVGQRFMVVGSGAGGYGDPRERDVALVARDVHLGYVSARSAEDDYGVLFAADGTVDDAATCALRDQLREQAAESPDEEHFVTGTT